MPRVETAVPADVWKTLPGDLRVYVGRRKCGKTRMLCRMVAEVLKETPDDSVLVVTSEVTTGHMLNTLSEVSPEVLANAPDITIVPEQTLQAHHLQGRAAVFYDLPRDEEKLTSWVKEYPQARHIVFQQMQR
jgi:KaiC/GvpD/RAD55 family RecA-like ATPase